MERKTSLREVCESISERVAVNFASAARWSALDFASSAEPGTWRKLGGVGWNLPSSVDLGTVISRLMLRNLEVLALTSSSQETLSPNFTWLMPKAMERDRPWPYWRLSRSLLRGVRSVK